MVVVLSTYENVPFDKNEDEPGIEEDGNALID